MIGLGQCSPRSSQTARRITTRVSCALQRSTTRRSDSFCTGMALAKPIRPCDVGQRQRRMFRSPAAAPTPREQAEISRGRDA